MKERFDLTKANITTEGKFMRDRGFSQALRDLKNGLKLSREGWNGKGLFVQLQTPDGNSKMSKPYFYTNSPIPESAIFDQVPWVPSQTDLMANDWSIVE